MEQQEKSVDLRTIIATSLEENEIYTTLQTARCSRRMTVYVQRRTTLTREPVQIARRL